MIALRDGKFALCGVTGEVKRLFDIGGFSDEFLIFATQADGIRQTATVTGVNKAKGERRFRFLLPGVREKR